MFDNATLLITGGTGSFGNAVLRRFLQAGVREIRIFSRDEKKQDDMRKQLKSPKVKFHIGSVQDFRRVSSVMNGVDLVLHAAALKQVPSCEFHPLEVVKTNVMGTENILEAAIGNDAAKVVCLSTDKAVYPINVMGMTKALMEKLTVAKARALESGRTTLCCTRYGNVMGSRGSVIPLFVDQLNCGEPLTVTVPGMTRFMMTMDQAVDLVIHAFAEGTGGDLFVHKAPAATMDTLSAAMLDVWDRPDHPVRVIGPRHGEKLYETLLSREELAVAEDRFDHYRVPPDGRTLAYDAAHQRSLPEADYNSHNTTRLNVEQMKALLYELELVQRAAPSPVAAMRVG